jgi:hypothetical protein
MNSVLTFMKFRKFNGEKVSGENRQQDLVLAEVNKLIEDHLKRAVYVFEYRGKDVCATFLDARLQTNSYLPNAYRIHLIVSPETIVIGECFITNSYGDRVEGFALTIRNDSENLVVIRTTLPLETPAAVRPFPSQLALSEAM